MTRHISLFLYVKPQDIPLILRHGNHLKITYYSYTFQLLIGTRASQSFMQIISPTFHHSFNALMSIIIKYKSILNINRKLNFQKTITKKSLGILR